MEPSPVALGEALVKQGGAETDAGTVTSSELSTMVLLGATHGDL